MKLHLAGLGWVADDVIGHRLRWAYPHRALDGSGKALGLPRALVVERAPLQQRPSTHGTSMFDAAADLPFWAKSEDAVELSGMVEAQYLLPSPVHALSFVYRGWRARVRVLAGTKVVLDRDLENGETCLARDVGITEVRIAAPFARLESIHTLDLMRDPGLSWTAIAEIGVRPTVDAPPEQALARLTSSASLLDRAQWDELWQIARRAVLSGATAASEAIEDPWYAYELALGVRWGIAVVQGAAFIDGPGHQLSPLDRHLGEGPLRSRPGTWMAYRVRDVDGRIEPSNIVLLPPTDAPTLVAPPPPTVVDPVVRLQDERLAATASVQWNMGQPQALGVEVEEVVTVDGVPVVTSERYECRSRMPDDPPLGGRLTRVLTVPSHEATLKLRARAIDGWDRTSDFSAWTPELPFKLLHHPVAPPLVLAETAGANVKLHVSKSPAWVPDPIVAKSGRVQILESIAAPKVAKVKVTAPTPIGGARYSVHVAGSLPIPVSAFDDGHLIAGSIRARIVAFDGTVLTFDAPADASGTTELFAAGEATLQQDAAHVSLWKVVAERPANDLPSTLEVPSSSATAKTLVISSYATRVAFSGRVGPMSSPVGVWRMPLRPVAPPPFSVETLGTDFYGRTHVRVALTVPDTENRFRLSWAEGTFDASKDGAHSAPGTVGPQHALDGQYLFDLLPIPVARKARQVTFALQRVDAGDQASPFTTVLHTMPAAST